MSPVKEQWKLRLDTVFWFVLGLGFLLSLPVLLDWTAWVILLALGAAMALAVPMAWLKRALFDRDRRRSLARHWVRASTALFFIFCSAVAAPIYYLATITETRPVIFPQATLTNGEKTVVFQGMQHIGSENFYKSVIYDIEKAIGEGYAIYYEGVQTATPESRAFFNKLTEAMTGSHTDLANSYRVMGETCGLNFQSDYFTLLEADKREHPERHVIADVDAIEMKQEYERLLRTDPEFARDHANDFSDSPETDGSDAGKQAIEWLESGSEGQKKLAGIVCRGIMTLALGPDEETARGRFDPIIIDFRNRALVERITEGPHDRIFITYGANHLTGVIDLLQQQDPRWKVATVKWMRTIEAPRRHVEGRLTPGH